MQVMERISQTSTILGTFIVFGLFVRNITAAPSEDLVQSLPQQPYVAFKQYAGYVTVNEAAGKALFYYFVEADTDAVSKPITLWLADNPWCSSVATGAFEGVGPFYVNSDGTSLVKNKYSWNKASNLLFLDSVPGVGWSYSNTTSGYQTSEVITASDTLIFLNKWFTKKFPEYIKNELYIGGQGYQGGHSVLNLANLVLDNNYAALNEGNDDTLNFKGIIIGNPFLEVVSESFREIIENIWSHGMISDATYQLVLFECFSNYTTPFSSDCSTAFDQAIVNESQIFSNPQIDPFDLSVDISPSETCATDAAIYTIESQKLSRMAMEHIGHTQMNYGRYGGYPNGDLCAFVNVSLYLSHRSVQASLHANTTNLPFPYTSCYFTNSNKSINISYELIEPPPSMIPVLVNISTAGVRIFTYSGDQDSIFPSTGTRKQIANLATTLSYTPSTYQPWYQGGQIGGWAQTYGKNNMLTFATVKGASQKVVRSRPAKAHQLFVSFINAKALPAFAIDSY